MKEQKVCKIYYIKTAASTHGIEAMRYQQKTAEKLLKYGFWDFFGKELSFQDDIERTDKGKPYYAKNPAMHFNISHCPDAVAAALSYCPVGIDAEGKRKIKIRTMKKCCSAMEEAYVTGEKFAGRKTDDFLTDEENERFLQFWTLKESFVKMTGEGLRMPINTITFNPMTFQKNETADVVSRLYIRQDLTLALTLKTNPNRMLETAVDIEEVSWGKLAEFLQDFL